MTKWRKVKDALEQFDEIIHIRDEYILSVTNDGGEPTCGYEEFDEKIADFYEDIAYHAENLADAVRVALKP